MFWPADCQIGKLMRLLTFCERHAYLSGRNNGNYHDKKKGKKGKLNDGILNESFTHIFINLYLFVAPLFLQMSQMKVPFID